MPAAANAPAAPTLPAAANTDAVVEAANAFLATLSEQQRAIAQIELTPRRPMAELSRLLVILAAMPWLVLLARSRVYGPFRIAGAALTGIAAAAWFTSSFCRTVAIEALTGMGPVVSSIATAYPALFFWCRCLYGVSKR